MNRNPYFLFAALFFLLPVGAAAQDSPSKLDAAAGWLGGHGLALPISVATDYSKNFRGGADTRGSALRTLVDFGVGADLQPILGWRGATAFFSFQNYQGRNGSEYVGDAQAFSNIDSDPDSHVAEAWLEQAFLDGRVRFKTGYVDANSEFAYVDNGGEFLNSSMGFSPTIMTMATYPDPRPSANLFVNPSQHFYAGAGFYDTVGRGGMGIGEAGTRWSLGDQEYDGRFGFGYWHQTGLVESFTEAPLQGTGGVYLVLDQTLWKTSSFESDRGVGAFFQFGSSDPEASSIHRHFGGGLRLAGPFAARPDDVFGVGVTRVSFSREAAAGFDLRSEVAVEWFYQFQASSWLSFTQDIQYIRTPGGVAGQGNSFAGTVRAVIDMGALFEAPEE